MLDTAERTARVLDRTRRLRRRWEERLRRALAAVCCALAACLFGAFRALTGGGGTGHVPGLYGSALLYGDAGGYVLAGVLAFAAGAVVTLLCIRCRKKSDKNREKEMGGDHT